MNQTELITAVKEHAGLQHDAHMSRKQVEAVFKSLVALTVVQLRKGGEITLPGIGKIGSKQRKGRTGRNPRSGDPVEIPAKRVPTFLAFKALKDELV
jgi:DNA-binding protein HU-beta